MDATPTASPVADEATADDHVRVRRLAEMVQHLTDCPPRIALHAVQRSVRRVPVSTDESLDVVARAIVCLKHGIDLTDQIDLS